MKREQLQISHTTAWLDYLKFKRAVESKIGRYVTDDQLSEQFGFCRATLFKITKTGTVSLETLKLFAKGIGEDPDKYIVKPID